MNILKSINNFLENKKYSKHFDRFVLFLILLFVVIYSFMVLNNHRLFETYGWDLSVFDQGIWQWSRFKFPYSSFHDLPWLADHFHPIMLLAVPFYWIWSDVKVLIVFQVFVICLGAIPIYLLSKKITKDKLFSAVLVFGYLTYYSLQWSIFSPIHELAFLPLFLGFTLYFWENKNRKLYWFSFILALLVKEEFGFLLSAVGVWELFTDRKRWKQAFLSVIIGTGISLFEILYLMPLIGGGIYRHSGFGIMGNSIGEVFYSVISNPILLLKAFIDSPLKIDTMLKTFWPWAFMPLFAPTTLIVVLQQFLVRFLDYGKITRWQPFVYSLPLTTLMAWGCMYSYNNLKNIAGRFFGLSKIIFSLLLSLVLIISVISADIILHEPINSLFKKTFYRNEKWMSDNLKAIECVPKDESLSSQNSLAPRLSQRENIKIFPEGLSSGYDYIIVDLHSGQSENAFHFLGRDKTIYIINDLVDRGLYEKLCVYNDAMVLKKVASTEENLHYPFNIDIYEK